MGAAGSRSFGRMALPFDVTKNPTWLGMQAAKHVITRIVQGHRTLGLVGGGAGVGKTHEVRYIGRQHGIKNIVERRPDNAEALVQIVWVHRDHEVLVHNECDHLFRNERAINQIKLLHEEPRACDLWTKASQLNQQYLENRSKQYNRSIAPPYFQVGRLCRQLFTCNLNYRDQQVIAQLPQEHWAALVRRRIDPVWIPIHGRDGRDLFEHTIWTATEGRMLRNHQFDYATSRKAINYYITHVHRLVDLSPARLIMLAEEFRDTKDRVLLEANLNQMLASDDLRPNLRLEQSMVQVLLWPAQRPVPWWKRKAQQKPEEPRPTESQTGPSDPPTAAAPSSEPAPVASEPPSETIGEPTTDQLMRSENSNPSLQQAMSRDGLSAIDAIKALMDIYSDVVLNKQQTLTCNRVQDLLSRFQLDEWIDPDDFRRFSEAAAYNIADGPNDIEDMVLHCGGHVLFVDSAFILFWNDNALTIMSHDEMRALIAPEVAEEAQRLVEVRRRRRLMAIEGDRLPPKRKLVKMRKLIDEMLGLEPDLLPETHKAMHFIRHMMTKDDEAFGDCATFRDYVERMIDVMKNPE
jgi:hypothetical protein